MLASLFRVRNSKNGEERACLRRQTSASPVRATSMGFEFDEETFKTDLERPVTVGSGEVYAG
jgi:hypothetical protein